MKRTPDEAGGKTPRTGNRGGPAARRRPGPGRASERPAAALLAWVEAENDRRLVEEDPFRDEPLAPADRFPPEGGWLPRDPETDPPARRRPDEPSRALDGLICGACSGWRRKPTPGEFERAMKSRRRSDRADGAAATVIVESELWDVVHAELENAYSLRDLAWWIHELGIENKTLIHWLNKLSVEWVLRRDKAGTGGRGE